MSEFRVDQQWLDDLRSPDSRRHSAAIEDLRDMLLRGLSKSLSHQDNVDVAFLEDIVQEATIKILKKLDSYQGRSKFRTWAITIAVRTAISHMRKKQWQDVSLDKLASQAELDPQLAMDRSETAEQQDTKAALLSALKQVIDQELTPKQWTAITAELAGMPLSEVADKLGTSPNSLYKLLHDARKKLRRGLEAAGFTIDDVRSVIA
ncbi:MAG: sigma-70 family RNA polymerase sigma factor [bacterium]|nr:sigma-70 family RNA polymerase sigma factor [bacterium]